MTSGKKCAVCKIVVVLAGVGALNWGLVEFLHFNLVTQLLGEATAASKVVYGLVAVAGLMCLLSVLNLCPCQRQGCEPKK